MKNVAVNTLNYTGIVTLSQYIGDKKVQIAKFHNTGGASLFNFLSSCLAGDFTTAKAHRPTKIKLLCRSGRSASDYQYESRTEFIFLYTPPEPVFSASESRVRFSFIISRDLIESVTYRSSQDEVLGIGLYANSAKESESECGNFMAFCPLADLDKSALTTLANAFLVVDWELRIANVQTK